MRIASKIGLLILIIFGSFWAAGFGQAGIRSGSLAAWIQSKYENVEKGSWFALLTSWGAKGYYAYGVYAGIAIILLDLIYVLVKRYYRPVEEMYAPQQDEPSKRNEPGVPRVDGTNNGSETKDPRIVSLNQEVPQIKQN